MAKILIVDDEANIRELVNFVLQKEGYQVIASSDGLSALKDVELHKPDLVLLDSMLPGMDGLEVCRNLRKNRETAYLPIIFLTAKSEELDKVIGLEMGADDYVTKPFSPRELIARIKARLRKRYETDRDSQTVGEREIVYGPLAIRPVKYEALVNGNKLDLTLKEFELLSLLVRNPGKVFNRDYLLTTIWGFDYTSDTRTVDVHVHHLRQKIEEDPGKPYYIETVRGVGYRFKELS